MSGEPLASAAVIPPRMRPGDRIGVIAPSGPALPAPLARGLEALASTFSVQVAPSARAPAPPPLAKYLTAGDEARAAETNAMIADPDVRGIVMSRGGYGLMRILPLLDAAALRADPKPILAFSDGTALLSWASKSAGVRGIHGEVAVRLGPERPEAIGEVIRALTDPSPLGRAPWPLERGASSDNEGEGSTRGPRQGALIPGNLAMTAHLVGTPWQLPLRGAIWWFEEVGERPYELDRFLTQLHLAGQLDEVAGVVVGDLVRCMDPLPAPGVGDDPASALAVVGERLAHFGLPYLHGARFGHGRFNPPLPFGARCSFDRDTATVEILDGAVA
jgi:muramoyltetrapeptide carboxypeptidase